MASRIHEAEHAKKMNLIYRFNTIIFNLLLTPLRVFCSALIFILSIQEGLSLAYNSSC